MNMTETWREAFNAWWRGRPVCRAVKSPRGFAQMVWQAAFKAAEVTVTTDEAGNAVAVTRTDGDGRVLSVIWEKPTRHVGPVATQMQMLDHLESLKTDPATLATLRAAATGQHPA